MNLKQKLIAVVGQTATGKTDLSLDVAERWSGEIISADSRQVYKGLDIGSAKISTEEMRSIPHHLLDVSDPEHVFSVHEYTVLADKAISEIVGREKLPIIVGGSGMYVDAVLYGALFPEVSPQKKLREDLETKSCDELCEILGELDAKRLESIEKDNPRRLVRAIEIATVLGRVPEQTPPYQSKFNDLVIGLEVSPEELRTRIHDRNVYRLSHGLIEEVENLHKQGLSWDRLLGLGLEYRYVSEYLMEGTQTQEELIQKLNEKIWQFAKRQKTWFVRNKNIIWFHPNDREKIYSTIDNFLLH